MGVGDFALLGLSSVESAHNSQTVSHTMSEELLCYFVGVEDHGDAPKRTKFNLALKNHSHLLVIEFVSSHHIFLTLYGLRLLE